MAQQEAIITSKSSLSLRSAPSKTSNKIDSIASGAKVEIIEKTSAKEIIEDKENYWYKIRFSGKEGYVFGGFLNIIANDQMAKELSYKDFQGTWEEHPSENVDEDEYERDPSCIFMNLLAEEKFVLSGGPNGLKFPAKIKEFNKDTASLIVTVERRYDGRANPPSQEDWKFRMLSTPKRLELTFPDGSICVHDFISSEMTKYMAMVLKSIGEEGISELKSKAELRKGETFVFKGFYLGMPLEDAEILIEAYLAEVAPKMLTAEENGGKILYCKNPELFFVANSKGLVTQILFSRAVMDIIFKSEKTPRNEFLQMFVNAYGITTLDRNVVAVNCVNQKIGEQAQFVYRSEKGFEVKFYEETTITPDQLFTLITAAKMYGNKTDYKAPGTFMLSTIEKLEDRAKNFD